jgi:hypothetical protein
MPRSALDILDQNYAQAARALAMPLLDVFRVARAACQGDLERAVILLEIAIQCLPDPRTAEPRLPAARQGQPYRYPPRSTNMRSIADSSGIPRETVRRKVAALVAEGLVLRRGNKLSISPIAEEALVPLRTAILRLAARNYETVAALHDRSA